jgi:4-alpha-glucanotransferase
MPTFAGFLEGTDIDDRLELKVLEASTAQPEHERRKLRIAMMKEFLLKNGFLRPNEADDCATLHRACLEFLATGQGRAVLVNFEDLWCEMDPQNVPGTWHERPNWRRRAKKSLEEIQKVPGAMETLRALNDRVHGK